MAAPSHHHTFQDEPSWNSPRPASGLSRPRTESEHMALPSIRQTFPDLHLDGSLANVAAGIPPPPPPSSSQYYPSPTVPNTGPQTLPAYSHSPSGNNRRPISSNEVGHESLRVKQVPRIYRGSETSGCAASPSYQNQAPMPTREYWTGNAEYGAGAGPSVMLPPVEMARRSGPHPHCSGSPTTLNSDRDMETSAQEYGHSYHHSSRYQSLPSSSIPLQDRTTFSTSAAYGSQYQDMGRYMDIGMGGETKQRKRRGNLPKETTEKLRAWFIAHLQHPYPTEDEKQDLMRQTGLQMNQISNWFINARRRQLPTMINNARAESDAMITRSHGDTGCGTVLSTTEHAHEYGNDRDDGFPLSDSEGGAYGDDTHTLHQRRGGNLDRESV
ncbi:hypothetical protein E4U21_005320 [Claviceps maximensis]|nr:hypothetical protein E4U21_005320 [Claviceps maximensis]